MNLHYWHVISKRRTCNTCHQQHGSRNDKLIRDSLTFGEKVLQMRFTTHDTGGTCASACHVVRKYDRFEPIVN
jgi:predicted CXXCH cytochrome family protein